MLSPRLLNWLTAQSGCNESIRRAPGHSLEMWDEVGGETISSWRKVPDYFPRFQSEMSLEL